MDCAADNVAYGQQTDQDYSRLLDAVLTAGSELRLGPLLRRIVSAAAELVGARYGAIGVLATDGLRLERLEHVGIDDRTAAAIGVLPTFCGVLGVVIDGPVRLADVSTHPRFVGFPKGHPYMRSFLGVPITVRGDVFGVLYVTEKRGAGEFTEQDEHVARVLATAAGVAVQNARLYEQSRRREAWLDATSRVTRLMLSGANRDVVFSAIAEHVRDLTEASDAGVMLPGAEGRLQIVAGVGPLGTAAIGFTVDPATSLSGQIYRGGGMVLNLTEAEVKLAQEVNPGLPQVGPTLLLPFGHADGIRGVISASRRPGAPNFPAELVPVVRRFAEQVDLAYELAERRRDDETTSLFADRDRIARNLHDLVIQRLFATGMALEGAANLISVDPVDSAARIRRAVSELDSAIKELRTTVFALQQPSDLSSSLRARVIEVVDGASTTLGFTPSLRFDGLVDTTVDDAIADQLLAVLREALSNVVKHARATRVSVSVSAHDELRLRVSDNGVGLSPDGRRSGLTNMAVRAEQLGGRLAIDDAQPGTQLCWTVPLGG